MSKTGFKCAHCGEVLPAANTPHFLDDCWKYLRWRVGWWERLWERARKDLCPSDQERLDAARKVMEEALDA